MVNSLMQMVGFAIRTVFDTTIALIRSFDQFLHSHHMRRYWFYRFMSVVVVVVVVVVVIDRILDNY